MLVAQSARCQAIRVRTISARWGFPGLRGADSNTFLHAHVLRHLRPSKKYRPGFPPPVSHDHLYSCFNPGGKNRTQSPHGKPSCEENDKNSQECFWSWLSSVLLRWIHSDRRSIIDCIMLALSWVRNMLTVGCLNVPLRTKAQTSGTWEHPKR